MSILQIIILAIVQGLAELLPVSSSAHVVVAEKLMRLDASSPQMTLLLVMLHTGTMFAVIVYFWNQWKKTYFSSGDAFKRFLIRLVWASVLTLLIGGAVKIGIEKTLFKGSPKAEIEDLFGRLDLIAPALAAAGLLILYAGLTEKRRIGNQPAVYGDSVTMRQAGWIGAIQGFCLPFRGFSRSGATISTGMLTGTSKERAERFSFALAVVLTPPAVGRELLRLLKASHEATASGKPIDLHESILAGILGAFFAFLGGLVALRWLSNWLEKGRWYLFGIYCLLASVVVFGLYRAGY
ncbi:MAG TPA: undecaprenyl-diphosphate phosphatase [Edaphobacter sp.]|jgi:undecaprenyl-diphosphatase|nr:undecaprenyl-diphosphate phosphatase [Edaphobacter sp.]